jgi:hypothetical protein
MTTDSQKNRVRKIAEGKAPARPNVGFAGALQTLRAVRLLLLGVAVWAAPNVGLAGGATPEYSVGGANNYFDASSGMPTNRMTGYYQGIPRGLICMWSGNVSTNFDTDGHGTNGLCIGWQLCNGSNGAPDLRGMFVKGWADGVNPLGTGGGAYTPAGTVTITNTTATGTVTITNGTTGVTVSDHSYTPAGFVTITNTVATATFAGATPTVTNVQTIALVTGSRQVATNGQATPSGTVTVNTHGHTNSFAGTAATITHTVNDAGHGHTNSFTGVSHGHTNAFTGTPATVEPAYVKLAFIIKL